MTTHLHALCFDATDPVVLARFWAGVLGRELTDDPGDGLTVLPDDDSGFRIRFRPTRELRTGPNQLHLHLTSSSLDDQARTVARALELGSRHLDVGQLPEEGHVVLADPEGNELCVIGPGSSFLAGCGFLGELACDGSPQVGHFWSEALGWPLVWEQDQETAIQSSLGGTKIAWGGPPEAPYPGRDRLRLELAPLPGGDQQAEVDRLLSLGATRVDGIRDDNGRVPMADPEGNDFSLLSPPPS
ncbi:VOC family protein [Nocardioides sp. MAHUQ-72]|uniref:VOC family protein n=1 Tax=unclassified Nocardioides TaxID=2615069 RepID=UPI00361E4DCF